MRVAVSGSTGRLGGAIVALLADRPELVGLPWTRADLDLDAPASVSSALDRDRPDLVVHCAAWTDVDGCALDPGLAEQRNGRATGELARACAARDVGLVAISTNEVFDGRRTDGGAYRSGDPTSPANPYGRSKRLGEELAVAAYERAVSPLWIVRTAWLFGPPGPDFPAKIAAAARKASDAGDPLRLVADEVGTPSFAADVAAGVADLITNPHTSGIHHVVNAGQASRADWARRVLDELGIDVRTQDVSLDAWPRPSTPPRWGVLEPTRLPTVGLLRPWQDALAADLRQRERATDPSLAGGRR
jgi:dTDP-4-dehydrorhamnose reductase